MSPENLKNKVEVNILRQFFNNLPFIAIGGLLLVIVFSIGISEELPSSYLVIWGALAIITSGFFLVFGYFFKKITDINDKLVRTWRIIILANFLLVGLSWGVAISYFNALLPAEYKSHLLLTIVIVMSVYFPVLMNYFKFYSALAFSIMVPGASTVLYSAGSGAIFWGFVLFGYLCLMLMFASWSTRKEYERIQLQFELFEQNQKVKEANDSKSRFLASASHDLRQPLQALGFYIVTLSDFLREPHKKSIFDKTLKAYQALENLLNQLLNVSKLNANLIEIVHSDFSMKELFNKLKNDYEMRAIDRGLSIDFTTQDLYAHSDIVSVERILRNLLENALRYTKEGFILARCFEENDHLVVQVSDTGIGIDQEHVNKIFDEFYQVKNPERDRNKGFGLGLYAVEKLANLLDTSIKVDSTLGKGSTFSIVLPIGKQPSENTTVTIERSVEDDVLVDRTVLLVDDDDVVLDSISQLFFSWGCQVLTASNYQEAVNIVTVEEIIPELLVVDYRLPQHKTGVDLIREIRELSETSIPSIILTGDTGEESLSHINSSGLSFIHKPANPERLKRKVKQFLSD
ncbi:response regulator [Aliikangiella marina]|uniref:histidine kinase n=1 Tax=Aliikangiella marina TaxID=1712262 RepID=A0A545TGM4_9GAMM|nr:hybrid sensor histidine kinase/response regulator [Aliikangiella marina]TQV76390.1 response regulator [Aliikangiella marina]